MMAGSSKLKASAIRIAAAPAAKIRRIHHDGTTSWPLTSTRSRRSPAEPGEEQADDEEDAGAGGAVDPLLAGERVHVDHSSVGAMGGGARSRGHSTCRAASPAVSGRARGPSAGCDRGSRRPGAASRIARNAARCSSRRGKPSGRSISANQRGVGTGRVARDRHRRPSSVSTRKATWPSVWPGVRIQRTPGSTSPARPGHRAARGAASRAPRCGVRVGRRELDLVHVQVDRRRAGGGP